MAPANIYLLGDRFEMCRVAALPVRARISLAGQVPVVALVIHNHPGLDGPMDQLVYQTVCGISHPASLELTLTVGGRTSLVWPALLGSTPENLGPYHLASIDRHV